MKRVACLLALALAACDETPAPAPAPTPAASSPAPAPPPTPALPAGLELVPDDPASSLAAAMATPSLPRAHLDHVTAAPSDALAPDPALRIVREHLPEIDACYAAHRPPAPPARGAAPSYTGEIGVHLTLEADGTVSAATRSHTRLYAPTSALPWAEALETCVQTQARSWRFDPPSTAPATLDCPIAIDFHSEFNGLDLRGS